MSTFHVGERAIGDGASTFLIAEIGANHNGDPALAAEMIRVAADIGVDAIKLQTYTADCLLADKERMITWGAPGREKQESVGRMFDRLSLPLESYRSLFADAERLGIIGFSTPFSVELARFLAPLVPCFKVASSDVTFYDLLRTLAEFKKPVLLSTGKSTLGEIDDAVSTLLATGCTDLAVLHCVAQYPAPMNEMNLRTIPALSAIYPDCVIGFSDHSEGITAALGAVALGARVIEKHFTLDKNMDGPDHWFSSDPAEMKQLVCEVRRLESALVGSRKTILACEQTERLTSTRSLVLARDIAVGERLTEGHLKIVRPGWGIHPREKPNLIGLRMHVSLMAGTVLKWEHLH
jgi:N,N'-diacetyllegionaminate synthase